MKFKSFDIVDMVLSEANNQFSPLFLPVEERVTILKDYCSAIDRLIEDGDGEEFSCEIDEDTMEVHIEFDVMDITVDDTKRGDFQQLLARSKSTKITNKNGEYITIHFIFPSLWDAA